jgi:hypothetical protein
MIKKLNEQFQLLEELIKKIDEVMSNPINYEYQLKWLMSQDNRKKLFEKNPKCFLMMKQMGREVPFFPICNRMGSVDPAIIKLSMKMVNKLMGNDVVDQDHLVVILQKLNSLNNKFEKEIPKPSDMAAKKANVTKFIKRLKNYF